MTATLNESQAQLPRLVELASQGEDVVITVEGKPKARLTQVGGGLDRSAKPSVDMTAWLKSLEELRRKCGTGKTTPTVEELLKEDRADRV